MSHIDELQEVIQRLHGAKAEHEESIPIKETFQGKTVWEGIVEVFRLHGHPKANKVYAWAHDTDDPERPRRHVTVLHSHPIASARDAVKAVIVRSLEALNQPKARKVGRPKLAKGHAKAHIVPVRFNSDALKRINAAAKANNQTISEWIRTTLNAATG